MYSREISAQIIPGGIDKEKHGDIIREITELTSRSRRQIPAANSKEFLEKIVDDKDYRKVLGKPERPITPDEINALKQDILKDDKEHGFIDLALERKNTWLDQAIKEKKWKVKAEEIRNWMKELENKHNNIIKQINDFKSRLNCKNQQELEL